MEMLGRLKKEKEERVMPRDPKLQTPPGWTPQIPAAVLLSMLSQRLLHVPKTAELELLKEAQPLARAYGAVSRRAATANHSHTVQLETGGALLLHRLISGSAGCRQSSQQGTR